MTASGREQTSAARARQFRVRSHHTNICFMVPIPTLYDSDPGVAFGSTADINGVVTRCPLLSGKQRFEHRAIGGNFRSRDGDGVRAGLIAVGVAMSGHVTLSIVHGFPS